MGLDTDYVLSAIDVGPVAIPMGLYMGYVLNTIAAWLVAKPTVI